MPFEVPKGWVWCNITNVTYKITDGTHNSPINTPIGDYKYITAKNIKSSGITLNNITYVSKYIHNEIFARCNPEKGDILYIKDGATTGVVTINTLEEEFSLLSSVALIKPVKNILNKYLLYYLQSSLCYSAVRETMKGVGITRITLKQIEKWNLPLPPFAEQSRIVAEIERWFALIDQIEQGKYDLQASVKKAKSKILDLAIHGKLVSQDPTDEPASELLKRINPKAEITCDNPHYRKLPKGWAICRLEDIVEYEQPTPYIVSSTNYDNAYSTPVLTAGKSFIIGYTNEATGIFSNIPCIIFDDFTTDSKLVDFPFKVKSSAMKILKVHKDIDIEYVASFMSITRLIGDTHKRYWISEYSKLEIPLPPYKEQKRIINRIKLLFNKLDTMIECL